MSNFVGFLIIGFPISVVIAAMITAKYHDEKTCDHSSADWMSAQVFFLCILWVGLAFLIF